MAVRVRLSFDGKEVVDLVARDLRAVLKRFGATVRNRVRASMKPQQVLGHKIGEHDERYTVWSSATPTGEPPRTRLGLIRQFIFYALEGKGVVIGPEALPGHNTECLARLELGEHPYMRPAFQKTIGELPAIWKRAVG